VRRSVLEGDEKDWSVEEGDTGDRYEGDKLEAGDDAELLAEGVCRVNDDAVDERLLLLRGVCQKRFQNPGDIYGEAGDIDGGFAGCRGVGPKIMLDNEGNRVAFEVLGSDM
jgi:hypothetical protein